MRQIGQRGWKLSVSLIAACLCWAGFESYAQSTKQYSVQVSAAVQTSPAQINLSWPGDTNAVAYKIFRKLKDDIAWNQIAQLSGSATSYPDANVSAGSAFEYKIEKTTTTAANYFGYGYIFAGINAPLTDTRGKLILIVENTYASDLAAELAQLQNDLVGDGWQVLRHDVSRNDSGPSVKALIKADYDADPNNVHALFLFGRIPVVYSGNIMPDDHPNHQGAWPADVYYGTMSGTWTDSSVTSTNAEQTRNWNVPGDGKFDQSDPPGLVNLMMGRVDLANMTCFSNKTPPRYERDLLRQYLNKDHNFRHARFNLQRRGYLSDNFVDTGKDPVPCSGWRNFSAFFGANNILEAGPNLYFSTLNSQSYLWSYSCGGGQYYTSYGTGSSDDFALNDPQVVFTMFMGSYFGDWDTESDFLRAPLGTTSYTLTCTYAGAPHSLFHHMALGETIGYGIRLTQNNTSNNTYFPQQGTHNVHIALMGDPTLRMHPVIPPANLSAAGSNSVSLSWSPSTDSSIQGYHVYRATSAAGPFARLTTSPIASTSYVDSPSAGTYTYMIRAIKLETSGSGTYYNSSQGIFVTTTSSGGGSSNLTPCQLSVLSASVNQFQFRLAGQIGQRFVVDSSSNLIGWLPIYTNTFSGFTFDFSDSNGANAARNFYRARTVP